MRWGTCNKSYKPKDIIALSGGSLFAWYDAAVYDATGAVSGGLRWLDRSGNGGHLDAPSVAASPTPSTCANLNNKPCLNFDGTNDYLSSILPSSYYSTLHDGSDSVVLTVLNVRASATNNYIYSTTATTAANGVRSFVLSGGALRTTTSGTTSQTSFNIYSGFGGAGSGLISVRNSLGNVNGYFYDFTLSSKGSGTLTNNPAASPYTFRVSGWGSTDYLNGDITEMIILTRPDNMSSSDFNKAITDIENELAFKYGLIERKTRVPITAGLIADYDISNFTASGGNVSDAPDTSINHNDLTINGTVPLTESDSDFNSRPSITGGSGYLTKAAFNTGMIPQAYVYAVCSWPATGNAVVCDGADASDRITLRENSSVAGIFDGLTTLNASSRPATGDKCIFKGVFIHSELSLLIERDGKADISANTTIGMARGSAGVTLLANYLGTANWNESLARLVIFDRELSPYEDELVRNYLKSTYDITPL